MGGTNNMKNLIFTTLLITAFQAQAGGGSSVGPGNPASINCEKLGGQIEIINTPQGQVGMCNVEEWLLFREMYARGLTKDHHYGPGGMPNPASVNCLDVGGTVRIVNEPNGQVGYCIVEEWTLFRVIN